MRETLRHSEAFEYYYALGNKRNLLQVAKHFVVAIQTANSWSRKFSWQERVRLRDTENTKTLIKSIAKQTNKSIVNRKADLLKVAEYSIFGPKHYWERLLRGEVRLENASDLEKISKLVLLLLGEATERSEHEDKHVLNLDTLTDEELKIFERAFAKNIPVEHPETKH